MTSSGPLIVTGANGILAQLVIKELLETHKVPPSKIIAVSRSVEKLEDLKKKGVEVRAGDFTDANSMKTAFEGGHRILIISTKDHANRRQHLETAIKEAAAAGVKHIVFTGVVSQPKNLKPFLKDLQELEGVLAKTQGVTYSVMGFNLWMETMMEFLEAAIATGTFYTTSAAGKAALISREDFARACAAALASNSTTSAKFEVTGPETIDHKTLVAEVSNALRLQKTIEVKEVSQEELVKYLTANKDFSWQISEEVARFQAEIDRARKDGNLVAVGNGFNKLTGKQPEKFGAFIERSKAIYAPKSDPSGY